MKKSRFKLVSVLLIFLLGLGSLPVKVEAGSEEQSKKAMTFEDFLEKREAAFDSSGDKSDKHFPARFAKILRETFELIAIMFDTTVSDEAAHAANPIIAQLEASRAIITAPKKLGNQDSMITKPLAARWLQKMLKIYASTFPKLEKCGVYTKDEYNEVFGEFSKGDRTFDNKLIDSLKEEYGETEWWKYGKNGASVVESKLKDLQEKAETNLASRARSGGAIGPDRPPMQKLYLNYARARKLISEGFNEFCTENPKIKNLPKFQERSIRIANTKWVKLEQRWCKKINTKGRTTKTGARTFIFEIKVNGQADNPYYDNPNCEVEQFKNLLNETMDEIKEEEKIKKAAERTEKRKQEKKSKKQKEWKEKFDKKQAKKQAKNSG